MSPEPLELQKLFSGQTAFLQISADSLTGLEKLYFHLKALQTRMQIDAFVAQVVLEISAKNTSFKISYMCFFVTHCTTLTFFSSGTDALWTTTDNDILKH